MPDEQPWRATLPQRSAHLRAAACPRRDPTQLEHRVAGFDFCRAIRGWQQAFGMTIAKDAPFKPKGGNRAENVTIDGQQVTWYRTEIAGTQIQARETRVELPDGRVAYMWVQANSPEQLNQVLQQTQSMKFGSTRLSSTDAGTRDGRRRRDTADAAFLAARLFGARWRSIARPVHRADDRRACACSNDSVPSSSARSGWYWVAAAAVLPRSSG
jgi:hypothetical protein